MVFGMDTEKKSSTGRGLQKVKEGIVVSSKMNKTVVVAVTRQVKHQQYGKFVRRTRKYMVHDEKNECGVGDTVRIMEIRPLSRHKSWKVSQIVAKAV